ncbi:MAG: hypothetical protein ACI8U3_002348 [Brevundimonas sp.]|jgi:hypothetical protein|uniref:hypothetical protein n=1 Tax=Brevundimonas sp. TaxID=1871086 RepID=UPI0039E66955
MTDKTDTATISAEEAAGRALVARTTFEREAVWLPMLAVQHLNAGERVIDGKTFTDCLIEGPAVMVVMAGTHFDGCNMGVAGNPRTLLLKPLGDSVAGVVGMSNCQFVRCKFAHIGFTGAPEFLEDMERTLISARAGDGAKA